MTEKQKSPTTPGRVEGHGKRKLNWKYFTLSSTEIKDLIIGLVARGFIPPSWATFALRVLCFGRV